MNKIVLSLCSGKRRQRELSRQPRFDDRRGAGGLKRREPPVYFRESPLRATRGNDDRNPFEALRVIRLNNQDVYY